MTLAQKILTAIMLFISITILVPVMGTLLIGIWLMFIEALEDLISGRNRPEPRTTEATNETR